MKFLNKHKPLIFLGLIAAAIMGIVILISTRLAAPTVKLSDSPDFLVNNRDDSTILNDEFFSNLANSPETTPSTLPDIQKPIVAQVEISFTGTAFSPSMKTVYVGQVVRWTNNSPNEIILSELIKKHSELIGVRLQPGESFALTLTQTGLWTVKEEISGKVGKFYIGGNTL